MRVIFFIIVGVLILPIQATGLAEDSNLENVYDFGSVSSGSEVTHTFAVPNNEKIALAINQVKTSCASTQILSYSSEIAPNESGHIKVRLVTSVPGDVSCKISIKTNSNQDTRPQYFIKGSIQGSQSAEKTRKKGFDFPADFLTRRLRPANAEIRISVDAILEAQRKQQEVILIDVRRHEAYEKLWILGSINIPLYLIKTKTFLKDKFVVLINEGYAYSQLEQEHSRLKDLGFSKVFILDGGLNGWRQAGARLDGDPFEVKKLAEITPKSFFMERHYSNWTVIDTSASSSLESASFLPEAIHIPLTEGNTDFFKQVKKKIRDTSAGDLLQPILILNEKGQGYRGLDRLIHKEGLRSVYYLEGGLAGYRTFLQRQALMMSPKKIKAGEEVCQSCQ